MPKRTTLLVNDQIYHIFNRGIAKMPIFSSPQTYARLIELIEYYRFANTPISYSHLKQLQNEQKEDILYSLQRENNIHIEILAFCFMNNHFHFLVKQKATNGIATWMSNIQNAYARYFNKIQQRSGPLFQPQFKAVRIQSDEQLLHVSRYIHLNPSTGYLITVEDLTIYPWSSLSVYTGKSKNFSFVDPNLVLGLIGKKTSYQDFVLDQADYQRELAKIKHLTLEE
jgi:putative transposase